LGALVHTFSGFGALSHTFLGFGALSQLLALSQFLAYFLNF